MSLHRKPWYRWRNVLLAVVVAVVGWLVYAVTWAVTAKPNPVVEYGRQLEELTAQAQPAGANGWPYLHEAVLIFEEVLAASVPGSGPEGFDFAPVYDGSATPQQRDDARRLLTAMRTRGVFEQLDEAAGFSSFVRPQLSLEDGPVYSWTIVDLGMLREIGKSLAAAQVLAVEDDDRKEAVDCFGRMLLIASACSYQATVLDQLVGRAVAALACQRVRLALMDGSVDPAVARGWLDHLRRRTPLGPMRLALEGERRIFLDAIQHTHTDNGSGNGRMLLATLGEIGIGPNVGTVANLAGFVLADRRALTDKANGLFAELIDGSEITRAQRLAGPFDLDQALTELDWRFMELKLFLPALDKAIDNADRNECMTRGTMLLIAVEGFRSENGRLPGSLDELVPDWLDAVPADPFSAAGFVYRPVPLDQLGRDFLLYSVGADGQDDGGEAGSVGPHKALTPGGVGLDEVFNSPAG